MCIYIKIGLHKSYRVVTWRLHILSNDLLYSIFFAIEMVRSIVEYCHIKDYLMDIQTYFINVLCLSPIVDIEGINRFLLPTLLQHIQNVLQKYPDDGQIFKVSFNFIFVLYHLCWIYKNIFLIWFVWRDYNFK